MSLADLWSDRNRVLVERKLWVCVLQAQRDLGVPTPNGAVDAYEAVLEIVDLDSIERRERVTRHDLKARLEEFCALAGFEVIHRGMTSCDVTENTRQHLIKKSLELLVPRLEGPNRKQLEALIASYPLRGIKGPIGTCQDQLDLLGGDYEKLAELERRVAEHLGFERVMDSVGQIYPCSLDAAVVGELYSIALNLQPSPWRHVLNGHLAMATGISGEQWNEGDVSQSVVRRVVFPGALLAFEKLLTLTLDGS